MFGAVGEVYESTEMCSVPPPLLKYEASLLVEKQIYFHETYHSPPVKARLSFLKMWISHIHKTLILQWI